MSPDRAGVLSHFSFVEEVSCRNCSISCIDSIDSNDFDDDNVVDRLFDGVEGGVKTSEMPSLLISKK